MKKLFAVILAVMMTVSLFVGCGSSHKAQSGGAQVQQTRQADPSGQKTAPGEPDKSGAKQPATGVSGGTKVSVEKGKSYTDKDHVAAYIHTYKTLPPNYITKAQANKLGWKTKGTLDTVAPGKSIGGDRFGNYEKVLPDKAGRTWTECDIDYRKGNRNAKRIVFSNDGLIYYSDSHYEKFIRLY